jgi:hypothetical protein
MEKPGREPRLPYYPQTLNRLRTKTFWESQFDSMRFDSQGGSLNHPQMMVNYGEQNG